MLNGLPGHCWAGDRRGAAKISHPHFIDIIALICYYSNFAIGRGKVAVTRQEARKQDAALSPARELLRSAIIDLAGATALVERMRQPVDRLAAIAEIARLSEAAALRAEIERLRREDAAAVEAWVRGGATGPRPTPREETLAAERRYAEIAMQAERAAVDVSALQISLAEAAERVRRITMERDAAVYPASVEAAALAIERMKTAIGAVLGNEATLVGLLAELRRIGDLEDCREALAARSAIDTMIREAKRGSGVTIDFEAGRQLIRALKTDATAELRGSLKGSLTSL